mmetsp:Transcript_4895/g.7460  ORF Transcript_4895/g.7460 Transcript_4895/m.7460 type:complete len:160 (-) Transcript_4895:187-666(-)
MDFELNKRYPLVISSADDDEIISIQYNVDTECLSDKRSELELSGDSAVLRVSASAPDSTLVLKGGVSRGHNDSILTFDKSDDTFKLNMLSCCINGIKRDRLDEFGGLRDSVGLSRVHLSKRLKSAKKQKTSSKKEVVTDGQQKSDDSERKENCTESTVP